IVMWNATLKPVLRISEEAAVKLSELTEGFSFAYLKELFLSSMMRWIARPQQATMERVMIEQVDVLRDQMVSTSMVADVEPTDDQLLPPMFGPMMGRSFMHRRPPF